MNRKKEYSLGFKLEALQLAETSGKRISELERDLGGDTFGALRKHAGAAVQVATTVSDRG